MIKRVLHRGLHGLERRLDALKARWGTRQYERRDVWLHPYRGYLAGNTLFLRGRVLERKYGALTGRESWWNNALRMFRRLESDEIPFARVKATGWGGSKKEVQADEEGYFQLEWALRDSPREPGIWNTIPLTLTYPRVHPPIVVHAEFVRVTEDTSFAVVSDIDDTILETSATHFFRMVRTSMTGNARTRMSFPGVAEFYQALARGSGAEPRNPIFYVSSSPWNFYDLITDFQEHQGIPKGPLMLRDFGLDREKFLMSSHAGHKLGEISRLFREFPDLPFLLVGDTGQKDPEIYHELIERYPDRVLAVYLRDVGTEGRRKRVTRLYEDGEARGIPMRIAKDTETLATHAAARGWIIDM